MGFQSKMKQSFTSGVLPAFILLVPLLLMAVALHWQTAVLDKTIAYTIALVRGLSLGSLAFYIVVLLGFAFSHTENGKRIIVPINITAVSIFVLWISIYFYFVPTGPWEIKPLTHMLDTQIMLCLSLAVMPFIYFYFTGSKYRKAS